MRENKSKLVFLLYSIMVIITIIALTSLLEYLQYYRSEIKWLFILSICFYIVCVLSINTLIGTTIIEIKSGTTTNSRVKNAWCGIYTCFRLGLFIFFVLCNFRLRSFPGYFCFSSVLYDIIYLSLGILTFKLEKRIKDSNINTNSNLNNNPKNDLIKEIYNIEEKINKAQNELSKKKDISLRHNYSTLMNEWKSNIFLRPIYFIVIVFIDSFLTFHYYMDVYWAFILESLMLIFAILRTIWNKSKPKRLKKLQTQLDDLLFIDEKSINFYRECSKMIKNGETITEVLSIIGQKYGYSDLTSAQAYYKKGEQEIEKQKIVNEYKNEKAKKDKLAETHRKEQADASEESSRRYKTGKEKYLVELRKWIGLIESQKVVAENMRTLSSCNANYRARTSDWAIAGGIGSALGGAGLGAASAINAQVKNEQEKENAQRRRALSSTQIKIACDIESKANVEAGKAQKYLKIMDEVLIDEQNVNEKFKLLECSNICISLTEGNNLCVKFKLKSLAQPMILSKPAIFDGVLKFSIYNKENKLVSTGYYIANGYGNYNYQNAGFKMEDDIKVICPIDSSVNLEDLRCEITPEALWFIEKSISVFKVYNSTITEAYESYKKTYREQAKNVLLNM